MKSDAGPKRHHKTAMIVGRDPVVCEDTLESAFFVDAHKPFKQENLAQLSKPCCRNCCGELRGAEA